MYTRTQAELIMLPLIIDINIYALMYTSRACILCNVILLLVRSI